MTRDNWTMNGTVFTRIYTSGNVSILLYKANTDIHIGFIRKITHKMNCEAAPIYTMKNESDRRSFRQIWGKIDKIELLPEYKDSSELGYIFDIKIIAANEYGDEAIMKILNIQINNGKNLLDVLKSKKPYRYVAKGLVPWVSSKQRPYSQNQETI